jgi:hypothetical protein
MVFADDVRFTRVQKSLALVTTANGVGSGFVVEMAGKKYLVTNDHVLRGGRPFSARLISGAKLKTVGVEIANARDLVRLPLADGESVPALSVSPAAPHIGASVEVYGNSDGAAVVTSISGRIVGVGPEVVETDAEFVRGNSGSPVVLADGTVAAVATYAIRSPEPADWLKKDTRFTEVRRFGVRLTGVDWIPMSEKDYFIRVNYLADLETFCRDVYALYFTDTYYSRQTGKHFYNSRQEQTRYRVCKEFPTWLDDLVDGFHTVLKRSAFSAAAGARIRSGFNSPRTRQYQRRTGRDEYDRAVYKVNSDLDEYIAGKGRKLLPRINRLVNKNDWKTEGMKEEARFWLSIFRALAVPE